MAHELIDFHALASKTLEKLSLSDGSSLLPFSDADRVAVLSDRAVRIPQKEERSFFSPAFIFDLQGSRIYPVFFLRGEVTKDGNDYYLRKSFHPPILNRALAPLLRKEEIHFEFDADNNDINAFLFSLQSSLDTLGIESRYSLVTALAFYDDIIIDVNRTREILNRVNEEKLLPKFNGYTETVPVEKVPEEKYPKFFHGFTEAKDFLFHNLSIKAICPDDHLKQDFCRYILMTNGTRQKNVAFVYRDEDEKEHLQGFLNTLGLQGFYQDIDQVRTGYPNEKTESLPPMTNTAETQDIYSHYEASHSSYLTLEKEKQERYQYPDLDPELADDVFDAAMHHNVQAIDIPLNNYSDSDFEKDQRFLKMAPTWKTLTQNPIRLHPYFGLRASPKREDFDAMQLVLITLRRQITDFQAALLAKDFRTLEGDAIQDFATFEEVGKDLEVLHDYNGFPKRLFRISNPEDSSWKISDLKSLYQAVSATKLMLLNLCHPEILSIDRDRLLKDYQTGSFFVRRRAKKILGSYLKVKKGKDVKTLSKILRTYSASLRQLEETLPQYMEVYGDSVSTMNGAVEIEANIKYLMRFRMRSNYHPAFSLDNAVVKKALRDKDYRLRIYQDYLDLNRLYQAINRTFTQYLTYFNDANEMSTPFEQIKRKLERQSYASVDAFMDYTSYVSEKEKASPLLQMVLDRYLQEDKPFGLFRKVFLYSLYYEIYQAAEENSAMLDQKLLSSLKTYEAKIPVAYKMQMERLCNQLYITVQKRLSQNDERKDRLHLYKALKQSSISPAVQKKSIRLFLDRYPIVLADAVSISFASPDSFDLVIVSDSDRYEDEELLTVTDSGKALLYLEGDKTVSKRLSGFPMISLDYRSLFGFAFEPSRVPDAFMELLREQADENGYDVKPFNGYPLCLYNRIDNSPCYLLVPNSMVRSRYRLSVLSDLREIFLALYHIDMISIIDFEAFFEADGFLAKILNALQQ